MEANSPGRARGKAAFRRYLAGHRDQARSHQTEAGCRRARGACGFAPTMVLTGQHPASRSGRLRAGGFPLVDSRLPGRRRPARATSRACHGRCCRCCRARPTCWSSRGTRRARSAPRLRALPPECQWPMSRRACAPTIPAALARGGISHRDRCRRRPAVRPDRTRRRQSSRREGAGRNPRHRQQRHRRIARKRRRGCHRAPCAKRRREAAGHLPSPRELAAMAWRRSPQR